MMVTCFLNEKTTLLVERWRWNRVDVVFRWHKLRTWLFEWWQYCEVCWMKSSANDGNEWVNGKAMKTGRGELSARYNNNCDLYNSIIGLVEVNMLNILDLCLIMECVSIRVVVFWWWKYLVDMFLKSIWKSIQWSLEKSNAFCKLVLCRNVEWMFFLCNKPSYINIEKTRF